MSTDTQTLRERFEKRYPVSAILFFDQDKQKYAITNEAVIDRDDFELQLIIARCNEYNDSWSYYQSGAEDNQCVVELPKIIEVKDQKYPYDTPCLYYSANEVIAAIKASSARIK